MKCQMEVSQPLCHDDDKMEADQYDDDESWMGIQEPVLMSGMNDGVGDLLAAKAGDLQRAAALFILKAREVRMITQDTLDELLPDITG